MFSERDKKSWCKSELETMLRDLRAGRHQLLQNCSALQNRLLEKCTRSKEPQFQADLIAMKEIEQDLLHVNQEIVKLERSLRRNDFPKIPTWYEEIHTLASPAQFCSWIKSARHWDSKFIFLFFFFILELLGLLVEKWSMHMVSWCIWYYKCIYWISPKNACQMISIEIIENDRCGYIQLFIDQAHFILLFLMN